MPPNNKSRGKYFEDKIAESIRRELRLTKRDIHRNISSGVALFEYGDIWLPWPCILECKYYKTFEVRHILEEKDYILNWLNKQVYQEVERFRKLQKSEPFYAVVIGKPYHPSYVVTMKENAKNNDFIELDNILPRIETQHLVSFPLQNFIALIKKFKGV